jgi:hypothetical protein
MKKINVGISICFAASAFFAAESVLAASFDWSAHIKTPQGGQWTDIHLKFTTPYYLTLPKISPKTTGGQSVGTGNKEWEADFETNLGPDSSVEVVWKSQDNIIDRNVIEYYFTPTNNDIPGSGGGSLTATPKPVPEPLTILGSVAALSFGAYAERKRKASNSSEKDNTKDS